MFYNLEVACQIPLRTALFETKEAFRHQVLESLPVACVWVSAQGDRAAGGNCGKVMQENQIIVRGAQNQEFLLDFDLKQQLKQ